MVAASLRLNGVDAKNHAIFTELTRVRQYFEKIKKVETPTTERENIVNVEAAVRVLRADLVSCHYRQFPLKYTHANP